MISLKRPKSGHLNALKINMVHLKITQLKRNLIFHTSIVRFKILIFQGGYRTLERFEEFVFGPPCRSHRDHDCQAFYRTAWHKNPLKNYSPNSKIVSKYIYILETRLNSRLLEDGGQLMVSWWFGLVVWDSRAPLSNNPFHFRGSQISKPPGPKPPIYHWLMWHA